MKKFKCQRYCNEDFYTRSARAEHEFNCTVPFAKLELEPHKCVMCGLKYLRAYQALECAERDWKQKYTRMQKEKETKTMEERLNIVDRALKLSELENISFESAVEKVEKIINPPKPKECGVTLTLRSASIYGTGDKKYVCQLNEKHDGMHQSKDTIWGLDAK